MTYFSYQEKPKFNFSPHSPYAKIIKHIRPHSKVLDVGCATGYLAKQLASKHCYVVGIEIDPAMAKIGKRHCNKVLICDIEKAKLSSSYLNSFDAIVFSDILEHLKRPDLVLINIKKYLCAKGFIIASIPNIARFEIRFKLLLGQFRYEKSGILNKGHLRFFTLQTIKEMFNTTGYDILKIEPTGLGSRFKIFPTLFAYQFVVIAKYREDRVGTKT